MMQYCRTLAVLSLPSQRSCCSRDMHIPAPSFFTTESVLTTDDGVQLAVRCYHPEGEVQSAVVVVHGFAGSRQDPGVINQAGQLAALGHAVVTYDARGHGESGGFCTMGDAERYDVGAAVSLARRFHHRVITVGASMGAISVLRYGSSLGDVAGVVSVSGPARWRLTPNPKSLLWAITIRTRFGRWMARRLAGVRISNAWTHREEPVDFAGRIHVPLAIVHGLRDRYVAPRSAHELFARARGPRHIELVESMGHAYEAVGLPIITAAVAWALSVSS